MRWWFGTGSGVGTGTGIGAAAGVGSEAGTEPDDLRMGLDDCCLESGEGERVPSKTETPIWGRCDRVTGRREPPTGPINKSPCN